MPGAAVGSGGKGNSVAFLEVLAGLELLRLQFYNVLFEILVKVQH